MRPIQHLHLNKSYLNKQNPPNHKKFDACIASKEKVQRFWLIYCLLMCLHNITFANILRVYLLIYLHLCFILSLDKPITHIIWRPEKERFIFAKQSTKQQPLQPNKRWRDGKPKFDIRLFIFGTQNQAIALADRYRWICLQGDVIIAFQLISMQRASMQRAVNPFTTKDWPLFFKYLLQLSSDYRKAYRLDGQTEVSVHVGSPILRYYYNKQINSNSFFFSPKICKFSCFNNTNKCFDSAGEENLWVMRIFE